MTCVSTSGASPSSAASPPWGSYNPPPRCLSVQRHEDAVAQPPVERLREMALAPRVLDKNDLTRADAACLAVARGELNARVEIDDVLPGRGRMPAEGAVG